MRSSKKNIAIAMRIYELNDNFEYAGGEYNIIYIVIDKKDNFQEKYVYLLNKAMKRIIKKYHIK